MTRSESLAAYQSNDSDLSVRLRILLVDEANFNRLKARISRFSIKKIKKNSLNHWVKKRRLHLMRPS